METTLESPFFQLGWGMMRTMTSLTGSAQTTHGPDQYLVNFLISPVAVCGVKSQTLAPGRKDFRS